jgi:hypothetical protein
VLRVAAWWSDIDVAVIYRNPIGALDPFADRLAERLAGDWQRIQAGEPPTCEPGELELPWGDLQSYSTGWIRRM